MALGAVNYSPIRKLVNKIEPSDQGYYICSDSTYGLILRRKDDSEVDFLYLSGVDMSHLVKTEEELTDIQKSGDLLNYQHDKVGAYFIWKDPDSELRWIHIIFDELREPIKIKFSALERV